MKKRIAMLLAAATMLGLMVGTAPSQGATGYLAGVFNGTAHLPKFPCGTGKTCTGGTFSGTFHGRINGKTVSGPITASYSYTEPDTLTAGCGVKGTAQGTITTVGHSGTFSWVRTGLTALVSITVDGHAGKSLDVFVPISTGFCQPLKPSSINATVAGIAATTN